MHPFQWCNGCFCGLGLVSTNKSCSMPPISFQDLPLNIYMVIFGTGVFVFMLSLIFCCYFISKLRNQAQSERYGYKEVVLKGDAKKLQLYGQTCAVCLEDFRGKDELGVLPCQHAFHRKYVGTGWDGMGGPEEEYLGSTFKTLLIPAVLFDSDVLGSAHQRG